jgi:signal transduction histidine kinase
VAVVGHVVRNAQDATPDDGQIIVRLFKQNDLAVIEVQDNGCGMDERFIQERLFKPFDSTKGQAGMGIGAHETRAFIKAMGGDVDVISRLGEGTTFRLTIPVSGDRKNSVKSSDTAKHGSQNDNEFKEIASS